VSFRATDIYRIADGKIAEEWDTLESLVILEQIGVVAAPR
jgi:predicted SnoaL-like aldol condensation-catalyzing enzyme